MPSTDPILKLVQLTEELWNTKKELDYTRPTDAAKLKVLKKLKKLWTEIKNLDVDGDIDVLCELEGVDKNLLK